ncbi:adenylate/guanylate cyclase domain-containing protein [Roseibium denhamense]|uniref:Adenylate cyclase n=1 Tax=Roseibium denhamense TaxID=76305 RepID=A0ABY1PLY0_9HYPH|nr:adenylate/guanylate cyclase domain-containing protein [Roseibium denhamense]MTI05785.1 adenylate/guanylate cyclase domain-containing protein [Roseibium denhamense]SMP37018.1 adenylate cyclase [Roseibium denhamense]
MAGLVETLKYIIRGGPPETGIPQRVRAEIRDQEASSERLIGWVQLGLVLFFAILYALAPRAEGSAGFNFVPLALGAYFLFTVMRLVLSYRFELPEWYLLISIGVDMALLVGLIFSFHIQYDQHPTFYLKAPTLMYVFIFIGLRALRFDPRFVLTTGLVAVAGWLGLVFYAALADMDGMRVTRNYVEYLTGNAILIGAELDKTMVILAVTILLSAAIYRGRALLFEATRDHAAAADLKRFFAPEVAASITDADTALEAGEGTLRHAAILYADIRSFTSTSSTLAPEVVLAVLAEYQNLAVDVINHEGGRVDKFLGDGILATFGALQPSKTFAADALRAANRLVEAIEAEADLFQAAGWPGSLKIGTAVAAGPVTAGVIGAKNRLEFTVIGDAVNRAAKLEDANKIHGSTVLTDQVSLTLAREQGFDLPPLETLPASPVMGVRDPVDLVVLAR